MQISVHLPTWLLHLPELVPSLLFSYSLFSFLTSSILFFFAGGAASKILQILSCKPDIDPFKGDICDSIRGGIILSLIFFFASFHLIQFIYQNSKLGILLPNAPYRKSIGQCESPYPKAIFVDIFLL